ncbi:MAG: prolipoprotein diacylglyceryl transferase family protein [Bacteroidota bacterium]
MTIPFEPVVFGIPINVHLILEYAAFFVGFRYYLFLRKRSEDPINSANRLSIILGAIIGALLGSRLAALMENPLWMASEINWLEVLQAKTIMGGLFGGLIGVELAKKIIGERRSSGDLFTFPLILGILIGRIGCFLMGVNEFTYGKETTFWAGMDLGDGLMRHPIALYEILFLAGLFIILKGVAGRKAPLESGLLFKLFMLAYFGFRFLIEFLKPNVFFICGLSSIQWLCLICWGYYLIIFSKYFTRAN